MTEHVYEAVPDMRPGREADMDSVQCTLWRPRLVIEGRGAPRGYCYRV